MYLYTHENDNRAMTKEKNVPEENIRIFFRYIDLCEHIHSPENICNGNRF